MAAVVEPVAVEFGVQDGEVVAAGQTHEVGLPSQFEGLATAKGVFPHWDGLFDALKPEVGDEQAQEIVACADRRGEAVEHTLLG